MSFETTNKINLKDKQMAEKLDLDDRIYSLQSKEAFITLKDHKDNFANNTKCRLLNPAKSDMGKVSKQILARVVKDLREKTKLKSWKNTPSVIEWFKKLKNKQKLSFVQFDIWEFYPSITKQVLINALNYAKDITKITKQEKDITSWG